MRKLLFVCLLAGLTTTSFAMKIEPDTSQAWRIILSGQIFAGDAEKLTRTLLAPLPDKPFLIAEIVLDSEGGDLNEAVRIASLIKGLHLDTRVRGGGRCASACFFLFLAGDKRIAGEHVGGEMRQGRIGLHRPYLKAEAFKKGDPTTAITRQQQEMRKITDYLRNENVPLRLIDEMMEHASNDIYWMSNDDIWLLGEYNPGLEEILIARCAYDKRYTTASYEKLLLTLDEEYRKKGFTQLAALLKCIVATRGLFDAQREAFIKKLQTGWRPWIDVKK
jgi:ATP-dependent protease ClpP protease subunit